MRWLLVGCILICGLAVAGTATALEADFTFRRDYGQIVVVDDFNKMGKSSIGIDKLSALLQESNDMRRKLNELEDRLKRTDDTVRRLEDKLKRAEDTERRMDDRLKRTEDLVRRLEDKVSQLERKR